MTTGNFSGTPKTEWLTEPDGDRNMRLLEDFYYEDPTGKRWTAYAGSIINGASIPKELWSSVGSPYTGNYRRASIVHDVACRDSTIPRTQTDEMFYFACLAGGCSVLQAKLLYAGVRIGATIYQQNFVNKLRMADTYTLHRLPNQYTEPELQNRALFTIISSQLQQSSDSFSETYRIINAALH